MSNPRLEIVTYKVGSVPEAYQQREIAMTLAADLPGFAGWLPLADAQSGEQRADLVVWADQDAADAAAKAVGASDRFAAFRATISDFGGLGHFALPPGGLPMMQAGEGMELGRFRMRASVTEDMLRAAHARMVETHLSHQPGWRGQRLVRLDDESWMDIAFAATADHAKAICASWSENADCQAFLALINPISMEFGSVT